MAHVQRRRADLCCVVIADKEYPQRVAFAMISSLLDEFLNEYPVLESVKAGVWDEHLKQVLRPKQVDLFGAV